MVMALIYAHIKRFSGLPDAGSDVSCFLDKNRHNKRSQNYVKNVCQNIPSSNNSHKLVSDHTYQDSHNYVVLGCSWIYLQSISTHLRPEELLSGSLLAERGVTERFTYGSMNGQSCLKSDTVCERGGGGRLRVYLVIIGQFVCIMYPALHSE